MRASAALDARDLATARGTITVVATPLADDGAVACPCGACVNWLPGEGRAAIERLVGAFVARHRRCVTEGS